MSVVSKNEEVATGRRRLEVEVPPEAVAAEAQRVAQEFRKQARLPGFRRGKVPLDLVRKRYHDEIEREVVERLVPRYWRQAQAEAKLELLLAPEIGDVDYEAGERLTFAATVDLKPEIELGDVDTFELPDPATGPEEAEVDKAVEDLRRQVGEWNEVDRPAARGDRVEGTLVDVTDGEPAGESEGAGESEEEAEGEAAGAEHQVAFEVGDPSIWEELSLAATGSKAGIETPFERREEAAEGEAEAGGGTTRKYRLQVNAVQELELPPLNDETAAKIGKFESVEELRERVAEELERRKTQESRRQRESSMLDQLIERHPLELPEKVVEHETEMILREYADELGRRGMEAERANVDWQRVATEAGPQARRRVHTRLLLDAVAEAKGIEVSASELEGQLALLARSQNTDVGTLRRHLAADGRLDELKARFRRGKVVDYLLGNRPPDESAQEQPAPEAREEE